MAAFDGAGAERMAWCWNAISIHVISLWVGVVCGRLVIFQKRRTGYYFSR
jgi:hypothetical protein